MKYENTFNEPKQHITQTNQLSCSASLTTGFRMIYTMTRTLFFNFIISKLLYNIKINIYICKQGNKQTIAVQYLHGKRFYHYPNTS